MWHVDDAGDSDITSVLSDQIIATLEVVGQVASEAIRWSVSRKLMSKRRMQTSRSYIYYTVSRQACGCIFNEVSRAIVNVCILR